MERESRGKWPRKFVVAVWADASGRWMLDKLLPSDLEHALSRKSDLHAEGHAGKDVRVVREVWRPES